MKLLSKKSKNSDLQIAVQFIRKAERNGALPAVSAKHNI